MRPGYQEGDQTEGILLSIFITRCSTKRVDALFYKPGDKEAILIKNAKKFLRKRYCAIEEPLDVKLLKEYVLAFGFSSGVLFFPQENRDIHQNFPTKV